MFVGKRKNKRSHDREKNYTKEAKDETLDVLKSYYINS